MRTPRSTAGRYGLAVMSVAIAVGVALVLHGFPIAPLLMAVAVTVWYAGIAPGLVAILLSLLAWDYFFLPPLHHLEFGLNHIRYFGIFTFFALLMSFFSASRRRAERALLEARDELEARVAERTAELRRMAAEAVAAKERFGDLVNSVEGIVWEADAEPFRFSFVSEQAERVLGYPAAQWLDEPSFWKEHLHPDDREWSIRFFRQAVAEKRSHDFEYRMIAHDGRVVWVRDLVTVVVESGRATRLRGVMVDVTERKRAEQQREKLRELESELAHINRVSMMGELAASIGHEIKQPIAAAITNANTCVRWLKRDKPDLEEARGAATRMIEDAMRSVEIINRTSSLYKKGAAQREPVDMNDIIGEIVGLLRHEAGRHAVSIRTELANDRAEVVGDRVQLQQVLMNLIINGIDAMKTVDGLREITLRSERDTSDHLLVTVSDTGVGLPPEMDQIFKAFFTTKSHGTGMGLAISRTIIESHGGRLSAKPNAGRGATFYFTLPLSAEAAA